MKGPDQRSSAHIECPDIAGRRVVLLIRRRAKDDEVFEHPARRAALLIDRRRIPAQSGAQIHSAVDAERRDDLSGRRVDRLEEIGRAENQPPFGAVLALPVVHASRVETLDTLVNPEFFPGSRIERHERVVRAAAVHCSAHDERIEVRLAGWVRPGHPEFFDIGLCDLGCADEPGAIGTTGVVAPVALFRSRHRKSGDTGQRQDRRGPDDVVGPQSGRMAHSGSIIAAYGHQNRRRST